MLYPLMVYFICLSHLSSLSVYFPHARLCLFPIRDWNCLVISNSQSQLPSASAVEVMNSVQCVYICGLTRASQTATSSNYWLRSREIMDFVAYIRLFVCLLGQRWSSRSKSILGAQLYRVQQRAKKTHYQSRVFVCVSNYLADAVDLLLICLWLRQYQSKSNVTYGSQTPGWGLGRPIRTKFWRCTLSFLSHLIHGPNMSKTKFRTKSENYEKKMCVS